MLVIPHLSSASESFPHGLDAMGVVVADNSSGYLEKLSFGPNSALRVKILSSAYQLGLG